MSQPDWVILAAMVSVGIVLVAVLIVTWQEAAPRVRKSKAAHSVRNRVRRNRGGQKQQQPPPHEHDWKHSATEWNAGKEVHVMVCWQHDPPAIERQEVA